MAHRLACFALALAGCAHAPQMPLATDAPIEPNMDYGVTGTSLRVRLHDASRVNLPEGHAWRAGLSVCSGADCTELSVGGPDFEPPTWRDYRFELLFVSPTSLRVTRASATPAAK